MSIEGKRTEDGKLSPYKRGCAVLAIETGATIIPIVMKGFNECLPCEIYSKFMSLKLFLNVVRHGEWRMRPGKVTVKICKKIETKGMTLADRFTLTDQLRQIAEKELGLAPKL